MSYVVQNEALSRTFLVLVARRVKVNVKDITTQTFFLGGGGLKIVAEKCCMEGVLS
jgi:hypothetical protein